jgi:hypothetical protein
VRQEQLDSCRSDNQTVRGRALRVSVGAGHVFGPDEHDGEGYSAHDDSDTRRDQEPRLSLAPYVPQSTEEHKTDSSRNDAAYRLRQRQAGDTDESKQYPGEPRRGNGTSHSCDNQNGRKEPGDVRAVLSPKPISQTSPCTLSENAADDLEGTEQHHRAQDEPRVLGGTDRVRNEPRETDSLREAQPSHEVHLAS